jgi:hypothetical protein
MSKSNFSCSKQSTSQLEKKQVTDTKTECKLNIIKADTKKSMEDSGKTKNPIHHEIEDKHLRSKHGTTKPDYRGGEYNGKVMLKLMMNTDNLSKDFYNYIVVNIPENEIASVDEVQEFASKYFHILLLSNKIFFTVHSSIERLDDNNIKILVTYSSSKLWYCGKNCLVSHILKEEYTVKLRGIGEFIKDSAEQAHQQGTTQGA